LEHSQQHRRTLEGELHRRQQDIQNIQDASKRMEAQHGLTRELLEARTIELKGAQSFLITADKLSGAEVSAMVEGLNGEIHQAAAFMAEFFEFPELKAGPGDDGTIGRTWIEEILGPTMLKGLSSVRHCEDPLVVQIALQACMTGFAARVITAWHLDESKDQNLVLNIYSHMRETAEHEAIPGRWRGLTRMYARQLRHSQSDVFSSLRSIIMGHLSHVLVKAGCAADLPTVQEVLRSRLCDRMSAIVGSTLRLHQALGEEITSADLEVIWIPSGLLFDPATMEDDSGQSTVGNGKDQKNDYVLCTIALGLQLLVRAGSKGGKRSLQKTDILKPKVILHSVTEGMARYDLNNV